MIFKLIILSLTGLIANQQDFDLGCSINQKRETIELNDGNNSVSLKKKEFSILFNAKEHNPEKNKFYSTQIAITSDKSDLGLVKVGQRTSEIPFYSPGTGNAAKGPYECFSLTKNLGGHQYVIYEKNGEKRAKLISEENGVLRLEITISCIRAEEKEVEINKVSYSELYVVVFSDMNSNQILEAGEFVTVSISFK